MILKRPKQDRLKFTRGTIWMFDNGDASQVEGVQGFSRPLLIMSNNVHNKHSSTVNGYTISRTLRAKDRIPMHVRIRLGGEECEIQLEQPRTAPKERLGNYMGTLSESSMIDVERAILSQLAIKPFTVDTGKAVKKLGNVLMFLKHWSDKVELSKLGIDDFMRSLICKIEDIHNDLQKSIKNG